jgi:ketosteroid isomerase-like protein
MASCARRRVRANARVPDGNLEQQRKVVDAFLAASRAGSFEALVSVLDPDVVFRLDRGPAGQKTPTATRGSSAVARQILARGARLAHLAHRAIVNGAAGAVVRTETNVFAIVGFTVVGERIAAIDLSADPGTIHAAIGAH